MKHLLLLLTICAAVTVSAQRYARPDTSFNRTGRQVLDTPIQSLPQVMFQHALQPDGKIVL